MRTEPRELARIANYRGEKGMKTAKEWKLIKAHRCLKCGGKCKEDKTKKMVIGRFWYCPKCDGKPVTLTKKRLNEKGDKTTTTK